MRLLKVATDDQGKKDLSRKCRDLLGKAEQIKAAETWLHCVHGESCGFSIANSNSSATVEVTEPSQKRTLSTREQIILLKGSKLYGSLFPPWASPPSPLEFELPTEESPYMYVCER